MPIKIAYTYVVADLLHVGHIAYLENAKALAGPEGRLIVGVLTDEATMEKKPKPTLPLGERIRMVKSLKCVDVVIPQETYSPIPNIKKIRPDLVQESESHEEKDIIEVKKITESLGGKVVVIPYYKMQSSTKIKEKVRAEKDSQKNEE